MTLNRAFEVAILDDCPPGLWEDAETVIIKAGYCPYCACDGEQSKLGQWEAGTHETYAGRECPYCEQFVICGSQDNGYMRADEPDTDAMGMCFSDAVSGF